MEYKEVSSKCAKPTFLRQLYEVAVGAAFLISGLCFVGIAMGFCAFVIGVAIPFGLFS